MTRMAPIANVPLPVKLRVKDYLLLDEAGAFSIYGKIELLDGQILHTSAQHRPHGRVKMALHDVLKNALVDDDAGLEVAVEVGIALTERDAPEPDLTLTSEPDGRGLIPAASVALVVEVANTTLASDLTRKAMIYARAGVPEYWVADVSGRLIHQMWIPGARGYGEIREVPSGELVTAMTIDGLTISTTAL